MAAPPTEPSDAPPADPLADLPEGLTRDLPPELRARLGELVDAGELAAEDLQRVLEDPSLLGQGDPSAPVPDLPAELADALREQIMGEPPLPDSLADGIPDSLSDARLLLGDPIELLLDIPASTVVPMLLSAAAALLVVGLLWRRLRAPDSPSPGAAVTTSAFACVVLYTLGRVVDPLLRGFMHRPAWIPEDVWARVGWFEWRLLDRSWLWGAAPLADHTGFALLVHAAVWGAVFLAVLILLDVFSTGQLRFSEPRRDLPRYFPWVGASTTRRADRRFRRWIVGALVLLIPVHALAGVALAGVADLASVDGQLQLGQLSSATRDHVPAPGAWVAGGMLAWSLLFHLMVTGKEPVADKRNEEEEDDEELELNPATTALERLRAALEALRPGVELEPLERREADPGERVDFPPTIAPLVREIFTDLTGETRPWAHQAELLEHLGQLWSMQVGPERGEVPSLEEERAASVVQRSDSSTPHALILAAEGSGRTTATLLAALHVYFDRGATSLVIVRDRALARRWADTLARAIASSSARWNVQVCVAGEDLASTLVSDRTPAIVVADLERCEAEVLCDPRTDEYLARLGLIVADDVDGFTGVTEMHLQLVMRRLWALLDRLHEAPYPAALLATAGAGASGMDAWAKHVLAVPLRTFSEDNAQTRAQLLLRRRDLVDGLGVDIPLGVLAQACDDAELPWHLRLAGDAHRDVRRAAFDLGNLRRHHREDPREAAIVIVEGTYPEVHREAARLAHAGVGLDTDLDQGGFSPESPVVLVLAPPGDEEMVLHEEAEDAERRELVAALPRAVPLAEPRVVRQRHFDRAMGREQDLDALRERFGARFVDETIARLGDNLRRREVLTMDARSDAIAPRTLLRSVKEGALGQPIDAHCVSDTDSQTQVVDAGTSEVLATLDRAVAPAVYAPGRIFIHPRGRFMILNDRDEGREASEGREDGREVVHTIAAEQLDSRERTTPDRTTSVALGAPAEWTEREFGGRGLPVSLAHARVGEHLHGVRRYAPGPKLSDHRHYEQPRPVHYGTDVCLVATGADPRPPAGVEAEAEPNTKPGAPREELPLEVLVPLAAALRMVLPCYLRASSELVDVDLIEIEGHRVLVFFDRTPGASGFARAIYERGLKDLLELARMVLERLVGPEFARLRTIHDRFPGSDPSQWRISDALRWLDGILDAPPEPIDEDEGEAEHAPGEARVEYTPGEGHGDLGRLWISHSGRTDDLVWTRHSWWSPVPLASPGGEPAKGKVCFDVAVERPAIAAAQRRATALAGHRLQQSLDYRGRLDLGSRDAHAQLLEADRADLGPIRERLAALAGAALVDTVLALVAAIPLHPRPLAVSDRGPLAVLARRRADLDAKLLLACALLPEEAGAEIVAGPPPEQTSWLRVHGQSAGTWDLRGPRPKPVNEDNSMRATLLLDPGDTEL